MLAKALCVWLADNLSLNPQQGCVQVEPRSTLPSYEGNQFDSKFDVLHKMGCD